MISKIIKTLMTPEKDDSDRVILQNDEGDESDNDDDDDDDDDDDE